MPAKAKLPSAGPRAVAYVSEPITRCPKREKGRIRTLIKQMRKALEEEPFRTRLYVPSEISSPQVRGSMAPEHVYLLDRIRVVECDFMLVIADQTSFGIGGEVEMATALGKPVVIFSREDNLSRFLVGTPANTVREVDGAYYLHYREWRDLKVKMLPMVEHILKALEPTQHGGIPFFDVGKQLQALRKLRNISLEELASRTGLRFKQLQILEKPFAVLAEELAAYRDDSDIDLGSVNFTPHQLEELANIGLPALHKLAVALEVPIGTLLASEDKGLMDPGHMVANQQRRLGEIREENLKLRAHQYDITFREYKHLHKILVDDFVSATRLTPQKDTRRMQLITEEDFKHALGKIRGTH